MRKSFQLPLLAAMALAAALAVVGCGDSDNNDGGTGGTGGSTGTGGTGGGEPSAACEAACDHVTDDCHVVFKENGGKEDCLELCAVADERVVTCLTDATCGTDGPANVAAIEACFADADCVDACAHVYSECKLQPWKFTETNEPLTEQDCVTVCGQQFSDSQIACIKDASCDLAEIQACQ